MKSAGGSWGRLPGHSAERVLAITDRFAPLPLDRSSMLPYGNGRSYGDVCRNEGGVLLTARTLDRFIAFDRQTGVLECESGVLLAEIIDLVLPLGWFPAVVPGTRFVTVGGAIANDVHGKNHHRAGSFGHHVIELELLRSDDGLQRCSPQLNPERFAATIGGLGLTGLILRATLQLRRVPGSWMTGDSQRFRSIAEFMSLSTAADEAYEYTVAWVDCSASGARLGRGIFVRGNHAAGMDRSRDAKPHRVLITPPFSWINRFSVAAFNVLYFHRPAARQKTARWHYRPFFFPLDGVLEWNRLYGRNGFHQYQCVIPEPVAIETIEEMLRRIGRSGLGSFLVVLKVFGRMPSRGTMSFARSGVTLAVDFPNRGSQTLALLDSLDEITRSVGGAVYPAKDARMTGSSFRRYFPDWEMFGRQVDPRFSSSFWRRVTTEQIS